MIGFNVPRRSLASKIITCWFLLITFQVQSATAEVPEKQKNLMTIAATSKLKKHPIKVLKATVAPVIDGSGSDVIWQQVTPISPMHEIFPMEGSRPAQFPEEIKVTFDERHIYVLATLFDDDMDNLARHVMAKGQYIGQDDLFGVVIDPFNSKRDGFYFMTNANAFKEEGLISNNNRQISEWDNVWEVKVKVNPNSWVVEMAIPFSSINFPDSQASWGINFFRETRQPEKRIFWSSNGNTPFPLAPAFAGEIAGVKDIERGKGFDVTLSSVLKRSSSRLEGGVEEFEPSLDVKFKPSSSLSTLLTINTDFSATEVDQQQVNLTRFSLFTPEKRQFFLDDADIFEFGDIYTNGKPYFSRNIGLGESGNPTSINAGIKVSGKHGRTRFGLLAVNQNTEFTKSSTKNLAVGRLNHTLNQQLSLGLISTVGDPYQDNMGILTGIDALYRNNTFLDGEVIEIKSWFQQSQRFFNSEMQQGNSSHFSVHLPNEWLNAKFAYTRFDKYFSPPLGFVNRTGIEQVDGWLSVTSPLKQSWMNNLYHNIVYDFVYQIDGQVQSKLLSFDFIDLTTSKQNVFKLNFESQFERLNEPFSLLQTLPIQAGDYQFERWQVLWGTDESKRLSVNFLWSNGEFFDGKFDYKSVSTQFKLNRFINFNLDYGHRRLKFGQELLIVNTASAKINLALSPNLYWNNWFQFNNQSQEIGIFSRFVWQRSAMNALSFVISQNYLKDNSTESNDYINGDFQKDNQTLLFKLSYNWRF